MLPQGHNQKPTGAAAEMLIAHELLHMGFGVCLPVGDTEPYDLIATHKRRITRLQIKATRVPQNGTYRVLFRRGRNTKIAYTADDCDFIVAVVYYPSGLGIYVVPVDKATVGRGLFWEVGKHPRYPDKWVRCNWEVYRNAWGPLY
jgi:hypothetical protein